MILWLLLGGAVLFMLVGGARAFERASVTSIKSMGSWVVILGGLTLALMLILTGKEGIAFGALLMFGPMLWQRWKSTNIGRTGSAAPPRSPTPRQAMSRTEAYEVLGLRPNASTVEIREAHRRLMRGAHPDAGGSDWLASRVNQARDILLG
jgi:DnaJ family protein C protein 19